MTQSSKESATVPSACNIAIFGKRFSIKCPADKIEELEQCARYVENKMHVVRHNSHGKITSIERIAMMAALEISHELLLLQTEKGSDIQAMSNKIQELQYKIESALKTETEEESAYL